MLRRTDPEGSTPGAEIQFTWEDRVLAGCEGDTVAAALLSAGVRATRLHPVTGEPRAPFCMMGTCFECLVEIDGVSNCQACQVRLVSGMRVALQRGVRR